ncbi:MAG: hypothetical protein Q4G60_15215 [bacterium]|nr:hypothetical protein [bacterium]
MGLTVNKGFTLRNPNGEGYRIPAEKAGEFRTLATGGRVAFYGDFIDALGEWESLGVSVDEVKLLLRQFVDTKKR